MTDRLVRIVKHWLVVLFAAAFALVLLRQASSVSDPVTHLIVLALLGYVTWQLGRPVWRAWKWWQRRVPKGQRPELPAPAQWITAREQRRRNRDVR